MCFGEQYGLKAYSPIAENYSFSHFKDFGTSAVTGTGAPTLATTSAARWAHHYCVEGGIIEELAGTNMEAGEWEFAALTDCAITTTPTCEKIILGGASGEGHAGSGVEMSLATGMTGYSTKENVNGMKVPHLHFGMQLVFDESKDTYQLWLTSTKLWNC